MILPAGNEAPVSFNDQSRPEPVGPDPRSEIYDRIDGPMLPLDKESQWEYFAEYLKRLFDWLRGSERAIAVPTHDVGVRTITVCKLLFGDMTASEIEARHKVSKQSISQCLALFREEFGDVPTLRTRGPGARQRMREAQLRVNHWKKKRPKPSREEAVEKRNESTATTKDQVNNCAAGGGK